MTATTTRQVADNVVATLFPGYFALVMATGIIAIGAEQQELDWVAEPLFVIAIVAAVLGFGGIAGTAAGIAKILFFAFLILALFSLVLGRRVPT